MSVLRVEEPPEPPALPAALPQDSARSRAAARWTEPVAPAATAPAPTARPQPARGRPVTVPLRLTRRGRVVIAVAAALLVAALSLVIAASAQATNHSLPSRGAQDLIQVTVRPGQSLWSVAESADPDQDTRAVVQQIVDLNSLNGDTVFAGQQLWVPRG